MILIKGDWYDIKDLDDAIQLVREDYNYELADRIEELVNELKNDYDCQLYDIQTDCDSYEQESLSKDDRILTLEDEVDELNQEVESLNRQIEGFMEE